MRIECVLPAGAVLGEGPIWDERRRCVWWIDIKAPTLHAYWPETRRTRELSLSSTIGSIGLRENGGIVAGMRNGFTFIDPDSGEVTGICNPEAHYPHNRFNDGRVDPAGRFWAGTMDDLEKDKTGQLYRLDPHGKAQHFEANFIVTNGIDWSVDGRTMYFVDTTENTIFAYDFDMATGLPDGKRVFARVPEGEGHPDGLTVDCEDHVWSAHWNGWRLTRYRPDGSVERVIEMPVPLVTKCCFGGPDLDVMFVTTASVNLDAETRAKAPLSGGLFAVYGLGIRGKLDGRFQG